MSRKAFPLMLNTVNSPTASAEGNTWRTSIRFVHRAFLAMRYQTSRGPTSSLCTFAASKSFVRLMTCKGGLTTIRFAICEFVKRNFAFREWRDRLMRGGVTKSMRGGRRAGGGPRLQQARGKGHRAKTPPTRGEKSTECP